MEGHNRQEAAAPTHGGSNDRLHSEALAMWPCARHA
eukprot:CAMPEP_0170261556 /NCGR_PEP_ID=MMETSP0116_2-20130129/30659_1 /TAXON_ID=400756 /ORGANISM="Durinskia baltica, Strain CSIRO CS-38" /LENGTH=35 /DNA_ID= /DNA_START= /DNA_END= /DNA_ORIENTATION=